jgi:hypothetical protein
VRPAGRDDTEADLEWIQLPDEALPPESGDDFELYPENAQAWEIFNTLNTQWRTSMAGATGLDYTALESTLRLQRIKPKHHPDIFWRVQHLERGALAAMSEQSKANGQ